MATNLWTRTLALGIVVTAAAIGNVSMSAPEIGGYPGRPATSAATDHSAAAPNAVSQAATRDSAAAGTRTIALEESPAAAETADAAASDDRVQMVPAIFARDPDVRVFFARQLNKWM